MNQDKLKEVFEKIIKECEESGLKNCAIDNKQHMAIYHSKHLAKAGIELLSAPPSNDIVGEGKMAEEGQLGKKFDIDDLAFTTATIAIIAATKDMTNNNNVIDVDAGIASVKEFLSNSDYAPPVKVDEGKALLDLIDKARTYNDGWIFTEEELIAGYAASQNQPSNK